MTRRRHRRASAEAGAGTPQPHPFAASPLSLWWRLVSEHGGVRPRYWPRFAGILATGCAAAPLRLAERLRYGAAVARTEIQPPVFIQGFARSGTTHLHNLMGQDPELGYVSTFHALASPFYLVSRGWLERLIAGRLPSTRPMDNVAVSLDLPQEEELALAAVSRLSSIHFLSFPGRAREIVAKMGCMRLTDAEMQEWLDAYTSVLRKATLASEGRRLVLKTPSNLGRTGLLRGLFPDAKFVFVVRDPYVVFASTMKLYRTMIPMCQLQDVDWGDIEAVVLSSYVDMTRQYMRDREQIPRGNLIEVRFEDVEVDALGVLERVYAELDLPGWDRARGPVAEYLGTLSDYRKNRYSFDPALVERVDREWGFAAREWGYGPPDSSD